MLKLIIELPENEWHEYLTESVWVEEKGSGKYKLLNSPFFAIGLSFSDVVCAIERNGNLYFDRVLTTSGHSTYRLILNKDTGVTVGSAEFEGQWEPLQKLGCSFEFGDFGFSLLSIDVPPTADIYRVYSLLEAGERAGIWDFQEGHCGHKV